MKAKTWSIGGIGAALLVALVPAQASAAYNYTSIGGGACQAVYPETYSYSTNLYHVGGGISNSDSTTKFVQCPIVRVHANAGSGLYYGEIGVYDPSASHALYCSITSYDWYGNYQAGSNVYQAGPNSGANWINIPATTAIPGGYFSLFCVMPASSEIMGIYTIEY